MDFREVGWGAIDLIHLRQDGDQWGALLKALVNIRFNKMLGNFTSGFTAGGLPRSVSKLHSVSLVKLTKQLWVRQLNSSSFSTLPMLLPQHVSVVRPS
jgi:hypothetical protein